MAKLPQSTLDEHKRIQEERRDQDARRYRWLKSQAKVGLAVLAWSKSQKALDIDGNDCDAVIDAAMDDEDAGLIALKDAIELVTRGHPK